MRTYLECIPCFLRQALDACRLASPDPEVHERVMRQTLRLAAEMSFDRCPPAMGQQIHQLLRAASGNDDPYREVKRQANAHALALLSALRERVRGSADPFATAVRLAIAGNIIDLACKSAITEEEVRRTIEQALNDPLDERLIADFRAAVESAKDILYLADNAGEIVLDRLLLEQMPVQRVTVAIRGRAVINDATWEDAEAVGLTGLAKVVDNGSDVPGTILECCAPGFQRTFERADLVVAKGQGNYETLSGVDKNVYFLLQAKCPVIARDIGCEVGQAVLCCNRERRITVETPVSPETTQGGENG